jgi:inhibitor of cysteine peptidase
MSNVRNGIITLMIYLILAVMLVTVCAASNEAGCVTVITENYNGKIIQITRGESFCLNLKENPSTGYSWQLSLSKGLSLVNSNYYSPVPLNNAPGLIVGASGNHSWKIKALAKGDQQIKGIYRRSWEKQTGKEEIFRLNVVVL